jgi:hypothetical protein
MILVPSCGREFRQQPGSNPKVDDLDLLQSISAISPVCGAQPPRMSPSDRSL